MVSERRLIANLDINEINKNRDIRNQRIGSPQLGAVHLAHMVDVTMTNGQALGWQHSGDGDRRSCESGELHFIRGFIWMDTDNRSHIPRQQTLTREITRRHNTFMFFDIDPSEAKSAYRNLPRQDQ